MTILKLELTKIGNSYYFKLPIGLAKVGLIDLDQKEYNVNLLH